MKICYNYCENCGIRYLWQASGSTIIKETSSGEKLGTGKHCYNCDLIYTHYHKLMQDELNKIEKKTIITYIETDEVNLKTLLEWDDLNYEEANKGSVFPLLRQCFPSLARQLPTGKFEVERIGKVEGRENFKGKNYLYSYWPSEKDKAKVKVQIRQDTKTKQILEYIKTRG